MLVRTCRHSADAENRQQVAKQRNTTQEQRSVSLAATTACDGRATGAVSLGCSHHHHHVTWHEQVVCGYVAITIVLEGVGLAAVVARAFDLDDISLGAGQADACARGGGVAAVADVGLRLRPGRGAWRTEHRRQVSKAHRLQ